MLAAVVDFVVQAPACLAPTADAAAANPVVAGAIGVLHAAFAEHTEPLATAALQPLALIEPAGGKELLAL